MKQDKIVFISIVAVLLQLLLLIPTWFRLEDLDLAWYIVDLSRVIRNFVLVFALSLIVNQIKRITGLYIIAFYCFTNIITVLIDYAEVDLYDIVILRGRQIILTIGIIISSLQIWRKYGST